jgi:hypothetical protein
MAPFAEHLGIVAEEFASWRPVFSAYQSRVLLVEGALDKEYFEWFKNCGMGSDGLAEAIEVVPYGDKDTLKNTLLVKFVLAKFDHVFVTYDLDADSDARGALERLGLKDRTDFLALGVRQPGKDCIEGLLPDGVLAAVNGRETGCVMGLGSQDNKERKNAKEALKRKYLEEFKRRKDYSKDELKDVARVMTAINARLCPPNRRMQPTRKRHARR